MNIAKFKTFEGNMDKNLYEIEFKSKINWKFINFIEQVTTKYEDDGYLVEICAGVKGSDNSFNFVWTTKEKFRDSGLLTSAKVVNIFLNLYLQKGIFYSFCINKEGYHHDIDILRKMLQETIDRIRTKYKVNVEFDDTYDTVVINQAI